MTRRQGSDRALLFASGYLLVWGAAGAGAYGVCRLGRDALGGGLAWNSGGRWFAAGVLGLAAVYEIAPLKDVCLAKCRSPIGFLLGSWRDGRLGALAMGSRHGGWCLGCCWALTASLFALGVMSLTWMALIAALIALEKTVVWKRAATLGHGSRAPRACDRGRRGAPGHPRTRPAGLSQRRAPVIAMQ